MGSTQHETLRRAGNRHRILFVAEAVTLAHVARLYALANALDSSHYEVCIACDPRFNHLFQHSRIAFRSVKTISSERFFDALAKGVPIYNTETLLSYIDEDAALIDAFQPDLVVGDFRLSLDIAATLARVPSVSVTNAYWSPYANIRYPVPDIPLARFLGVTLAQRVFDVVRPLAFGLHALPLNRVRKKYGLAPLSLDLRETYTHADYTLYADLPEIVSVQDLPASHRFIGPVLWSPDVSLPPWWNSIPGNRPVVYANLGSSGASTLLPLILSALAETNVSVIAATAGRTSLQAIPPNAFVADYLPGDEAAKRASVVICNGGSPAAYQALAAGKPVIGIAGNLDQYLNMSLVEKAGAGRLLRSGNLAQSQIRTAVTEVLKSTVMRESAMRLAESISAYDSSLLFAGFLGEIFDPANLPELQPSGYRPL